MNDTEVLECLDRYAGECSGSVEYRAPLSNTGKPFPRCDHHWDLRLKKQQEIDERYAPNSDAPPVGFDPAYAGERWDDDY